jgi:hypothetical protein
VSKQNNNSNMFEVATRAKVRFPSTKGPLSVEQLWDVPLRSRDGFDLNAIAKSINGELKAASEENFVDSAKNPAQAKIELQLDLVKFIIQSKLDDEEEAKNRADRKAKREKLLEALSKKQDDALGNLSEAQIKKELEALSD